MIKTFFLVFLFFIGINSYGQTVLNDNQKLKFKQFSLTEGLSQSSVQCIIQDHKGFMWFGTRDGLNKFDGQKFITYRHNSQDSTSISNSFIKSLIEDQHGNLWVGTMNGLNKYKANQNTFERFVQDEDVVGLLNYEIWDMALTKDGYLWLGTNHGLIRIDPKSNKATRIETPKDKEDNFNNPIRSLFVTNNGDLWISNTTHIEVYDNKSKTFKTYQYPRGEAKEVNKNYAPVIYEDNQNNLFLGYKNGLFVFDAVTEQFKSHQIKSKTNVISINDEVRSIKQDHFNNLWIGTYNGLFVIHEDNQNLFHYKHDENDRTSLSQNSIYTIYEDVKGDFWIGTYAGGVNYYDRSYDVFKSFTAGTNDLKLNYMVVSSIIEDPNQNLWIGTEGGGINFYDIKSGRFQYITHQSGNANSLSTNNVKAMIRSSDGHFWIGTHDGGLNVLNSAKQPYRFKTFVNNPNDSTSLSSNRVISLFEDARQDIWIGTSGGGLNKWRHDSNTIMRINDPLGYIGSIIYAITPMVNKSSLLISSNKGLAKINILTHELVQITYSKTDQRTVHIHPTLYAYQDVNENLWIATEGDGLYNYNLKTQESIKYGMSDGLPNEVIYGILPDDFNSIWLSTNNGLSRLDLSTKTFSNFDVSDGLVSNEFNYGSFTKLNNGELMFGGASGITYFNPNDIIENAFVPPVSITSFLVNNKSMLVDIDQKCVELRYDQNTVNFNFVALSFSQPNKNQYAYKLEGFDEDWINIGNNKSATYTNLDSGNYIFKVKAANSDGLWNEEGTSMALIIKPAPWLTWWAYVIYMLLLLALLLMIRKYSLIRLHEKNELKWERQEKERIEEINQMKLRLFTNVSHDFRTPLTLIIGPLERMLHKKIGNTYIQRQHEIMHRNASVLLQLINQLLDFRKSESGHLKLTASKGDIVPFIENVKMSFDELARLKGIDYQFHCEEESIELWFDKIDLKKVIYNLLSNAFKFTPLDGQILINVSRGTKKKSKLSSKEFLRIEVKDSGRGVPKEKLKFIFDRFYQLGRDDTTRSGTGIGLALTKSIVELHHGKIKAKSKEGEGTTFIVQLPMGNTHLSAKDIIKEEDDNTLGSFYLNSPDYMIKDMLPSEPDENFEEAESSPSGVTILVVEDNIELRLFIKSIFEWDYDVLEAEHGEMAIDIANNHKVDLIISDVMMPKMDGIELCQNIKGNISTSHIPVILLTAKTAESAQKQGYQTGADAYITKPFDANILEMKVNNLLKTRKRLIEKFKKDLILEPSKPELNSPDETFLQKAIDLVEAHINDSEYSINDFVNEMGMSRSALYRKLKALTDQSITEFIRTIKLKRAGQLILQTDLNISEIAFDLGFNDLKHFRKSFQKLFGELPSEYRVKYGQNTDDTSLD